MPASDFEFRHRSWFIFGTFCVGLGCYWLDPKNSGVMLATALRTHIRLLQAYSLQSCIRAVFLIAALIVVVGAMIHVWGEAFLRADIVHDSRVRTEKLVADGPFRYSRNPLYLGVLVGVVGAAFLSSRTGWIAQMSLAIMFCYRLILREEKELFRTQGERFSTYCRAVPRLLPALKPRLPALGAPPHWRESFKGQTPWWGAAAAEIAYAATLRLSIAISVGLAGFALFVVQKYLMKSYGRRFAAKEMR